MTRSDFYKLVGITVHLDYQKIPKYCLAWSPSSLCYDPFLSEVMSCNHLKVCLFFTLLTRNQNQLKKDGKGSSSH